MKRTVFIPRRALVAGLAVAVVTQAAWMVPYSLATNGGLCSHGAGPTPAWAGPWLVPWVDLGTLPATAVISPTGPWIYVFFNAAFWITVVLAVSALLANGLRPNPGQNA